MNARDELRKMALTLATGVGPLVEPKDFDAALDAFRAEVLAEAIEVARSEHLKDDTGTAEDEAYNQGVDDAVAAIGALLEGDAP